MTNAAIKYPSTSQFRQVIRTMYETLSFDGLDENNNVKRKEPESWVVPYIGTVKIHGTNASAVMYEEGAVSFQSKERVLSLTQDNSGFMGFMVRKDVSKLFNQVISACLAQGIEIAYPIEIAGEWAGRGIQKGVAVSEVEPFFTIFRVAVGTKEHGGLNWFSPDVFGNVKDPEARIFNIMDFETHVVNIDFKNPELIQNRLVEYTMKAEAKCPVGAHFGVEGVGEGFVWTPLDNTLAANSGLWFKVKGEKHSVSKVKTLAEVDPVRLANIQEFIAYAVTDNRLDQGIQEVGLDQSKIGEYIGWVSRDVNKEEGDVLEKNSLTMKDVAKFISNKARGYYLKKLDEQAMNG